MQIFIFYFLMIVFILISLFLAVLGLHCCTVFFLLWPVGVLSAWGAWASHRTGSSCCGSRALSAGSVVVAHELSCSEACGIFPDQGFNPSLLHWSVDSWKLLVSLSTDSR